MMRKIDSLEELKEIQLNILVALHRFCVEHGIKYSLAAGSLIGAVRHKGFIPWDDDIDIYLMRHEYNKLISLFPNNYEEKYCLLTIERDKNWHRSYGKLCDNRTIEIEETRNKSEGIGIGIDIFPIDDVPDDLTEWMLYEKLRRLLRNMMTLKSLELSKKRSIIKNILVLFSRIVLSPLSFRYLSKIIDNYAQKCNMKGYSHVYENCLGVYNSKHPWLKHDLEEVIDVIFEGHGVKIMQGYDDYLVTIYGDYMQLPPEEKRVTHHAFKAYWK